MQFLADENVSRLVIESLRSDGHDIRCVQQHNAGISDPEVLRLAGTQIILIAEDQDFGELVIRRRIPVAGVLLLELDKLSNIAEADRVATVVKALGDRLSGNLVVVEPARTRIRPLPSKS